MEGGLTPATHYGARRIDRMYRLIGVLRKAIREEGNPRVQAAWDDVEPFIDFAFTATDKGGD